MERDIRSAPSAMAAAGADNARYAARILSPLCGRSPDMSIGVLIPCYIRFVSLDIAPVDSSRDLRRFIDLPWHVYNPADHPQWVPPLRIAVRDALDKKANPFY